MWEPEPDGPYWDMIVGANWPTMSPAYWRAMERVARDNAVALGLERIEQARNAFDDRVRFGAGLQPIKDDMRSQQHTQRAFADALVAAADTFGDFAVLVDRTRNQILDIVDRTTKDIAAENDLIDESGGSESGLESQERVVQLVEAARQEIADVMRNSASVINPANLPGLERIAALLAQPSPWTTRGWDGETAPPRDQHRRASAADRSDESRSRETMAGSGSPLTGGPDGTVPVRESALSTASGAVTPLPGVVTTHPPASGVADPPAESRSEPAEVADATPGQATVDGGRAASRTHSPATTSGENEVESVGAKSDTADEPPDASPVHDVLTAPGSGSRPGIGMGQAPSDAAAAEPKPLIVPGLLPLAGGMASAAVTPFVARSPSAGSAAGPFGSPASLTESRAPESSRAPAGPATHSSDASAAHLKPQSPHRVPRQGDGAAAPDSRELVRGAVEAAMVTAAAPAHLVGDRVDADLILARTLLAGVLEVAGSSVAGLQWAVAVLRQDDHASVFLASTEGRGWIPAGLLLPRAVSTPWHWALAEAEWEGIADPARVLAEFATVFGHDRGARMSALASSLPIDRKLRGQLGGVSLACEVAASAELDLSTPQPELIDRFGLIASQQATDYVASVPAEAIGGRCADLAWDAHRRVAEAGPGPFRELGVADARQQILAATRRGLVGASLWDELRDIDDLLAASQTLHRSDVSRSALGELRAEWSHRASSEFSVLRDLTFQRRCNELVLLLAEDPTRQCLRDAVYAHAHIAGHPFFAQSEVLTVTSQPQVTVAPDY
ncbi:hypothetical protein ACFYO1_02365 [Nocardia sp. NPDC006044]|uniref:hypothetical protein n=1 Tax=Nocardia sp. NPDC006044 TaxID=3364306 RepID=UPI0036BC7F45